MHSGEESSRFYFLLKGELDVFVENESEVNQQALQKQKKMKHQISKYNANIEVLKKELQKIEILEDKYEHDEKEYQEIQNQIMNLITKKNEYLKDNKYKLSDKQENLLSNLNNHNKSQYFQGYVCLYNCVAQFQPYMHFGDAAILTGEARSASILARTDAYVVYLDKVDFKRLFGGKLHKVNYPLQILRQHLKNTDIQKIIQVSYAFRQQHFTFNKTIISQGQSAQYLYLIQEGEIEISQQLQDQDRKNDYSDTFIQKSLSPKNKKYKDQQNLPYKRQIQKKNFRYHQKMQICTLGPGSFFGFEDQKTKQYEFSATTVSDAKLYKLDLKLLFKHENQDILKMIEQEANVHNFFRKKQAEKVENQKLQLKIDLEKEQIKQKYTSNVIDQFAKKISQSIQSNIKENKEISENKIKQALLQNSAIPQFNMSLEKNQQGLTKDMQNWKNFKQKQHKTVEAKLRNSVVLSTDFIQQSNFIKQKVMQQIKSNQITSNNTPTSNYQIKNSLTNQTIDTSKIQTNMTTDANNSYQNEILFIDNQQSSQSISKQQSMLLFNTQDNSPDQKQIKSDNQLISQNQNNIEKQSSLNIKANIYNLGASYQPNTNPIINLNQSSQQQQEQEQNINNNSQMIMGQTQQTFNNVFHKSQQNQNYTNKISPQKQMKNILQEGDNFYLRHHQMPSFFNVKEKIMVQQFKKPALPKDDNINKNNQILDISQNNYDQNELNEQQDQQQKLSHTQQKDFDCLLKKLTKNKKISKNTVFHDNALEFIEHQNILRQQQKIVQENQNNKIKYREDKSAFSLIHEDRTYKQVLQEQEFQRKQIESEIKQAQNQIQSTIENYTPKRMQNISISKQIQQQDNLNQSQPKKSFSHSPTKYFKSQNQNTQIVQNEFEDENENENENSMYPPIQSMDKILNNKNDNQQLQKYTSNSNNYDNIQYVSYNFQQQAQSSYPQDNIINNNSKQNLKNKKNNQNNNKNNQNSPKNLHSNQINRQLLPFQSVRKQKSLKRTQSEKKVLQIDFTNKHHLKTNSQQNIDYLQDSQNQNQRHHSPQKDFYNSNNISKFQIKYLQKEQMKCQSQRPGHKKYQSVNISLTNNNHQQQQSNSPLKKLQQIRDNRKVNKLSSSIIKTNFDHKKEKQELLFNNSIKSFVNNQEQEQEQEQNINQFKIHQKQKNKNIKQSNYQQFQKYSSPSRLDKINQFKSHNNSNSNNKYNYNYQSDFNNSQQTSIYNKIPLNKINTQNKEKDTRLDQITSKTESDFREFYQYVEKIETEKNQKENQHENQYYNSYQSLNDSLENNINILNHNIQIPNKHDINHKQNIDFYNNSNSNSKRQQYQSQIPNQNLENTNFTFAPINSQIQNQQFQNYKLQQATLNSQTLNNKSENMQIQKQNQYMTFNKE